MISKELNECVNELVDNMSDEDIMNVMDKIGEVQQPYSDKDYIEDNVLLLDTGNLSKIVLDKKAFEEGVNEVSKLCGKIVALCNVGITPSMALSYISEKEASDKVGEYNLKISQMNADATVESSKYGMSSVQKMMM